MSLADYPSRALFDPDAVAVRADVETDGRTLYGHFAVFDTWTEIDSRMEGNFLERIAPGAFDRTLAERGAKVKVLYEHGMDPQLGNKPLGTIRTLRADAKGVYYEVDLLDAPYVNDNVLPPARAGLLGASFRFRVVNQDKVQPKRATETNPNRLMERTITDLDLYEFGPVTFGAYADATSGVRSMTDAYAARLLTDPLFLAQYVDRVGLRVAEPFLAALVEPAEDEPADAGEPVAERGDTNDEPRPPAPTSPPPSTKADRQRVIRQIEMTRKGIGKGR